jgi:hypothetical protein
MCYNSVQSLNAIIKLTCCKSKPKEVKDSKVELLDKTPEDKPRVDSVNEGGEEQEEEEWDYDKHTGEENLEFAAEKVEKIGVMNWKNEEHSRDENFYKTVAVISDKKEVKFKEDILSVILCMYTKENVEKYKLTPRQRAKYLSQAVLV